MGEGVGQSECRESSISLSRKRKAFDVLDLKSIAMMVVEGKEAKFTRQGDMSER
jgi:hypothetical protein